MHNLSAVYAVLRLLDVCLSVTFVRPILCREIYASGAAYTGSCYGMQIGNRTQAFEWYHFQ